MNRLKLSVLILVDANISFEIKIDKTVRISTFIRQPVPYCRVGVVERPTAVRAESTARHGETVQVGRS